MESGVAEAKIVDDYVRGADIDIGRVMAEGFTWGFGRLPQNRALIEWMAAYNRTRSA